ncbi:MAG: hypothetical protein ACLVK0_13810 [Parabacteroides merdae]
MSSGLKYANDHMSSVDTGITFPTEHQRDFQPAQPAGLLHADCQTAEARLMMAVSKLSLSPCLDVIALKTDPMCLIDKVCPL